MDGYLGVDVGLVTTKCAIITGVGEPIADNYLLTQGKPVSAVQQRIGKSRDDFTLMLGSLVCASQAAPAILRGYCGADVVKNEITAQAKAALYYVPDVHTVIEIGGQDSKLIVMRDGMGVDFAVNTDCAAGTGSFLDWQALRLNMKIENFGKQALQVEPQCISQGDALNLPSQIRYISSRWEIRERT